MTGDESTTEPGRLTLVHAEFVLAPSESTVTRPFHSTVTTLFNALTEREPLRSTDAVEVQRTGPYVLVTFHACSTVLEDGPELIIDTSLKLMEYAERDGASVTLGEMADEIRAWVPASVPPIVSELEDEEGKTT